jgi:hypothetical protein
MAQLRVFSKRHEQAIYDRRLALSLPKRLRRRIWSLLTRFDHTYYYQPDPDDNWREKTSVLEQLPGELCHRYGEERLLARTEDGGARVPVDLKGFVEGAYPSQVFDVAELFYAEIPAERRLDFQLEMNSILEEERSDWRMADGQFFKVDSQFLEAHVIAKSYELLKAAGFEGALDELNQARNELAADNVKGAIHNACKSLESVIKAVSDTESGNASALVRGLADKGFYDGIPEDVGRAFGEQVLMALPFLRNRLGGHGQGANVLEVPRLYGELAVHLAATFIHFVVHRSVQLRPPAPSPPVQAVASATDDDIPF